MDSAGRAKIEPYRKHQSVECSKYSGSKKVIFNIAESDSVAENASAGMKEQTRLTKPNRADRGARDWETKSSQENIAA